VQKSSSRANARFAIVAVALLASVLRPADTHAQIQPVYLTQEEVEQIVAQAATEASRINRSAIIAVTDREGFVLALWDVKKRLPRQLPRFDATVTNVANVKAYSLVAAAVTRASSAAFLSSDEQAFTSRTAGFIIQQHFPPGVRNTTPGPLVGVGFSSLFFSDVNRVKLIPPGFVGNATTDQLFNGVGTSIPAGTINRPDISPGVRAPLFPLTSLNDSPGGVPLYKGGHLVGGIGVTGDGDPTDLTPAGAILFGQTQKTATTGFKTEEDTDEFVALAGQTHFRPPDEIVGSNVLINGIRVPYVHPRLEDIQDVRDVQPIGSIGQPIDIPLDVLNQPIPRPFAPPLQTVPGVGILIPPVKSLKQILAGKVTDQQLAIYSLAAGTVARGFPQASPEGYPYEIARLGGYEGEIRFPFRDDPKLHDNSIKNDFIGDARRLTKEDVKEAISLSAFRALNTRAGIRLPIGTSVKVFISVIANPDNPGEPPQILGVFRTGEATIFSWDVAVQKARTALFFSNTQLAMSSRSVGFLAQRFFPPGIDATAAGPYFGFQEAVTLKRSPRTAFFPGNPNLPNGITIFPGGFPLYKDGFLVGAIGISGDGVDQDDIIAISGCEDFRPAPDIRSDVFTYRGARLPYVKFPRDPVK
jgi:uncharacterized protein GlcG (DUF336 family)